MEYSLLLFVIVRFEVSLTSAPFAKYGCISYVVYKALDPVPVSNKIPVPQSVPVKSVPLHTLHASILVQQYVKPSYVESVSYMALPLQTPAQSMSSVAQQSP